MKVVEDDVQHQNIHNDLIDVIEVLLENGGYALIDLCGSKVSTFFQSSLF